MNKTYLINDILFRQNIVYMKDPSIRLYNMHKLAMLDTSELIQLRYYLNERLDSLSLVKKDIEEVPFRRSLSSPVAHDSLPLAKGDCNG